MKLHIFQHYGKTRTYNQHIRFATLAVLEVLGNVIRSCQTILPRQATGHLERQDRVDDRERDRRIDFGSLPVDVLMDAE
jgi:hypothetical protein